MGTAGSTGRPGVGLGSFDQAGLALLSDWLRGPHVAPWYPSPEEDLAWVEDPPADSEQLLIVVGSQPVGYIRWQVVDRRTLDSIGLSGMPHRSVDADLLIGEAGSIGMGIGPAALELLVTRLSANPDLPLVGLTSSVDNARAHRAFLKAGFRVALQYTPAGFGLCDLFVRSLRPEATW